MSVHTEVVIAHADEAQSIADSDEPSSDRQGFVFNGFDSVQLCTLLSIIKAGDPGTAYEGFYNQIEFVSNSNDDFPVVSSIPVHLVNELKSVAALEDDAFMALTTSWSETGEFDGWKQEDVQDLLRELGDLAETASLDNKCLMIWQNP